MTTTTIMTMMPTTMLTTVAKKSRIIFWMVSFLVFCSTIQNLIIVTTSTLTTSTTSTTSTTPTASDTDSNRILTNEMEISYKKQEEQTEGTNSNSSSTTLSSSSSLYTTTNNVIGEVARIIQTSSNNDDDNNNNNDNRNQLRGTKNVPTGSISASSTDTINTANDDNNSNNNNNTCDRMYTIIISGNHAYLEDLLTWWYHCERVGLCCKPQQQQHDQQTIQFDNTTTASVIKPCCSRTTFYAEDETIYNQLKSSKVLTVKKSWETGTNHNNYNLTGTGRFTYSKKRQFNHLMSRRPIMLYNELVAMTTMTTMTTMTMKHEQEEEQQNDKEGDVLMEQNFDAVKTTSPTNNHKNLLFFFDLDTFLLQDPLPYLVDDVVVNNVDDDNDNNNNNNNNTIIEYDFWGQDALNNQTGPFNGGFLVMKPTPGTLAVVKRWRDILERRTFKPSTNQKTFNNIVREFSNITTASALTPNVRGKLLPVANFLAGKSFENRDDSSIEPLGPEVVLFHNNFCDLDKECSKIQRAKTLGLWHPVPFETIMG